MNREITLDETIEVARPLHEVFAYIADFASIEQWDPAVARAERLGEGPPAVGSAYRVHMKAGFALHYRVVEFEAPRRLVMDVTSRPFTAREEILFDATQHGTRVRYIARFRFRAPLAALVRAFPAVMDGVARDTMAGMRRALEDRFEAPRTSLATALADRLVLPGLWQFTRFGYRRAQRRWQPCSAWLGGRHAVVTGASSGIGFATAQALAARGATVTLVGRDARRMRATAADIRRLGGNDAVRVEIADLERMTDVDALVARLRKAGEPIHILVNNAGALFNPRQTTAEGLERSFALLLLAPYRLTEGLQPLLAAADGARVVNVLSGGMYTQRIDVDDLQSEHGNYSGAAAYARAKRGLMILTGEWASAWAKQRIVVNAMHPGWADTPGIASALPAFRRLTRAVLRNPAEGADTAVWLAAAPEAADLSGRFWLDREPHPTHVFPHTRETAAERRRLLEALAAF